MNAAAQNHLTQLPTALLSRLAELAALRRLDDGVFSDCADGLAPSRLPRLAVLPAARYGANCQPRHGLQGVDFS